ncbi:MAG: nucleotide exchange factor GrpE [Bdellovibrionia bacterium]
MSGEIPDNKTTNLENDADDEGTGEVAEFSDELTANISNDALASAQKLLTDLEKSRSDFLYLRAEFENYKKQVLKERSEYLKYGSERVIAALLDVLDNFSRALAMELDPGNKKNIELFKQGLELTASEFKATLKRFGVEPLECMGKPFDPHLHEALGSEESDQVKPGHISQVFRPAYKLHDRVIRPAQVIVAKEKS